MSEQMREEFENSSRFKGMDFTRSVTHPEYYESPYANGALDGWKAKAESQYTAIDMTTAAADGFRDGVASAQVLRKALSECTASLEGEILQKYHGQKPEDMHPVTRRDYDRDMAEIEGYKDAIKEETQ
jgi:hypothetical protein